RRTQDDLFERIEKVDLPHRLLLAARREQRRLVDEILELGCGEPRRRSSEGRKTRIRGERHAARVHAKNGLAAVAIWKVDDDAAVEATWPHQRTVEHIRLIRRAEHDDAFAAREAIHLRQDLVQRLLLLR